MSPKTTMFLPRNLGGVIARLAPTPDGGAEVVAWDKGAWRAAPFSVREVATAPVASDARLAELGIPNPATPAQEPFEEQKAGDPAMFHTLSTFVPRDLGGVIVRLAYARGGKLDDLEVLAWEGDAWHRRDIPISDALAAPAASDDHLLDIGYPEPEEEALQPFFRLLVKLEAGRRVIERMHTRAAIAKAERGEPLTPSEIALLPRDKHPAGFTDLEAA
jgi:hypothetical protein